MNTRETIYGALKGFSRYGYDWDGSGGLPVRGDALDTAYDFLLDNPILGHLVNECPPPSVLLNASGTIELAFDSAGKTLLLTVECAGVISYIRAFEDEQTSIEGVIRLGPDTPHADDFVELTELFDWIASE